MPSLPTVHQHYRRMDGRLTIAIPRFALRASRGKTLFKLSYSFLLYTKAMNKSGLDCLDYRRDLIMQNIFKEIKDPKHPPVTYVVLPPVNVSHSQMILHLTYPYQLPFGKATRFGRDFIQFPRSFKAVSE